MERTIDRRLLASFIEYAAEGKATASEWQRFAVNHYYSDDLMEQPRSECVRILIKGRHRLNAEDQQRLMALADGLRNAPSIA